MANKNFLTDELAICLDVIRTVAALVVLVGHAVQLRIYTGPFPFTSLAQHNAVLVFFVLSGIVIASTTMRPGATLKQYVLDRASRILSVSLPALAFSLLVFATGQSVAAPHLNPAGYDELTAASLLLPILFLSEHSFGTGPPSNPPYWSLAYEVWFYAFLGAVTFLKKSQRLLACSTIAMLAGPRVLLLLPIWLFGVLLVRKRIGVDVSPKIGAVYIILSGMVMALVSNLSQPVADTLYSHTGLNPDNFRFSMFFVTDMAMGALLAIAFVGVRSCAEHCRSLLTKFATPARAFAGFSFTLYLFHWPMLCLLRVANVTAGESPVAFAAILVAVLLACAALTTVTEQKRPYWRSILEGLAFAPLQISASRKPSH